MRQIITPGPDAPYDGTSSGKPDGRVRCDHKAVGAHPGSAPCGATAVSWDPTLLRALCVVHRTDGSIDLD